MSRVKRGTKARQRRNKILKQTKGFVLGRKNKFKVALQTLHRSLAYAFRDRKAKKREFRALWNQRISAAAKLNGTNYSRLIFNLKQANIELNRKMLSEIAVHDPVAFTAIVKKATPAAAKTA